MKSHREPFHAGEVLVQERAKTRDDALYLASAGMTEPQLKFGHPEFMAQRREAFIASVDPQDGSVWASAVFGEPGFVRSADAGNFEVRGGVLDADPLRANAAAKNGPLGFLFIDLSTRRRIRSNGLSRPSQAPAGGLSVAVRESFGNCPQYIQRRVPEENGPSSRANQHPPAVATSSTELSASQQDMIAHADTLFIASYAARGGADMSHRGGLPGFVRVTGANELWWPDYPGNGLFNTLGNLVTDARCGLLFLDFDGGSSLQLTGRAEVLFAEDLAANGERLGLLNSAPEGAARVVVFHVDRVLETADAVPSHYRLIEFSPSNPKLSQTRSGFVAQPMEDAKVSRPVECVAIREVAEGIKEFVFEAPAEVAYQPGQYATFSIKDPRYGDKTTSQALTRHWTISSSPGSLPKKNQFSITVKRQDGGVVSTWLHDSFRVGETLNLEGIDGSFVLPPRPCDGQCKVLLLSAGIGITPMLSMLRGLRHANASLGSPPMDVVFLHTSRSLKHIPYRDELVASYMERPDLVVRFILTVTSQGQEGSGAITGRTTESLLRKLVPDVKERQVYVCGPDQYMSDVTQFLQNLNLPPGNLHMEAFDF